MIDDDVFGFFPNAGGVPVEPLHAVENASMLPLVGPAPNFATPTPEL